MARKHPIIQKKHDHKKHSKAKFPWQWAALGGLVLLVGVGALILWLVQPAPTHPAEITAAEAYGKYQAGTFLVDVRTQEEWNEVRVPGVLLIPLDELEQRLREIPKGEEIVVICRSGNRSKQGRDVLQRSRLHPGSLHAGRHKRMESRRIPGGRRRTEPMTLDLNLIRGQFPALRSEAAKPSPAVFFDNPGGTQIAQASLDRVTAYLVETTPTTAAPSPPARQSDAMLEEAHAAMADFYNAAAPGGDRLWQQHDHADPAHQPLARPAPGSRAMRSW